MSLFSFVLIAMYESNSDLVGLSFLVILFSVVFFGSVSLLSLFISFELVTLPVILIIFQSGGQPEKILAILFMILFTTPLSMIFLYVLIGFDLDLINMSPLCQGLLIGLFLVNSPLFSIHSWLPKAHVEAPTVTSMLLAGVLLNVGLYGLINVMSWGVVSSPVIYLSALGIVLTPLMASLSADSKQLSALSSTTHINLLVNGLCYFSLYFSGGSYLICLAHGFISSMMFMFLGSIYHKNSNRLVYHNVGVSAVSGLLILFYGVILLGNAGVPPTLSFWGELMVLSSMLGIDHLFFLVISVYFIYSFYYSVFLLIHLGGNSLNVYFGIGTLPIVGLSIFPLLGFFLFPL